MADEGFKRKLTAILSADVVGYSRLMEDNEEATIQTLNAYRNSMSTLIEQYRGRVVDMTGDNLMAEFSSVVDAVRCAVDTQKEIKERNADLSENRRMLFRIGVNLGDIVEEDDRIYGDGVNIAARLEGMAEGGGICISGTAYDHLKNKLKLGYEYLGEHSVKNIAAPVRVYKVLMEPEAAGKILGEKRKTKRWLTIAAAVVILIGLAGWYLYIEQSKRVEPASVEKMAFPLPERPSLAVLPFVNFSGDPKQEYLSDGITEQLITTLSKSPEVFVISRTSTFAYKGKAVTVKQVSEDLGVRYILEGSVQKSGDRVRITAQLIDAITGRHLWAERYDRNIEDIFALQDELTIKILEELAIKLTAGEKARMMSGGTDNIKALEKLLEATKYVRAFNKESNAVARRLYEETIALDPQFSAAYSLLAGTHVMDVWLGISKSPRSSLEQAIKMLQKSIALDKNAAFPHSLLGHVYAMQRRYEKAIAEGEQAIALNPNSDDALVWLAMTMDWVGRSEEAVAMYKKAMRLCPSPPAFYYLNLGNAYRSLDRCEDAIGEYKKTLHLTPHNMPAHSGLVICYSLLNRNEEARTAAAEVLKINPKHSFTAGIKRTPYTNQDLKERIINALRKAGLP
jgi:adenylate cyclase